MRFEIAVLAIFAASVGSGCGIANMVSNMRKEADFKEAKRIYEGERAGCEREYPDPNQKPVTPRVRCLADAAS